METIKRGHKVIKRKVTTIYIGSPPPPSSTTDQTYRHLFSPLPIQLESSSATSLSDSESSTSVSSISLSTYQSSSLSATNSLKDDSQVGKRRKISSAVSSSSESSTGHTSSSLITSSSSPTRISNTTNTQFTSSSISSPNTITTLSNTTNTTNDTTEPPTNLPVTNDVNTCSCSSYFTCSEDDWKVILEGKKALHEEVSSEPFNYSQEELRSSNTLCQCDSKHNDSLSLTDEPSLLDNNEPPDTKLLKEVQKNMMRRIMSAQASTDEDESPKLFDVVSSEKISIRSDVDPNDIPDDLKHLDGYHQRSGRPDGYDVKTACPLNESLYKGEDNFRDSVKHITDIDDNPIDWNTLSLPQL